MLVVDSALPGFDVAETQVFASLSKQQRHPTLLWSQEQRKLSTDRRTVVEATEKRGQSWLNAFQGPGLADESKCCQKPP